MGSSGIMPWIISTVSNLATLFSSAVVTSSYLLPSGDFYLNPDLDKYELP